MRINEDIKEILPKETKKDVEKTLSAEHVEKRDDEVFLGNMSRADLRECIMRIASRMGSVAYYTCGEKEGERIDQTADVNKLYPVFENKEAYIKRMARYEKND